MVETSPARVGYEFLWWIVRWLVIAPLTLLAWLVVMVSVYRRPEAE